MERPSVLRDAEADRGFHEDGYAVVELLTEAEVTDLLAGYEDLVGSDPGATGMGFDYLQPDREPMEAVARLLEPIWARHLDRIFVDHRVIFTTFVHKHPGDGSEMYLHDDRTYVDERHFRACTAWIPLVDTSLALDNGCLHVIPGSHRITDEPSGTNTTDWIRPHEELLRRFLAPLDVEAGHAVLYDTRLLHWSPPNRSGRSRPAVACAVIPREADLVHVVADGPARRAHAVDPDFYRRHHPLEVERAMPAGYPVVREWSEAEVLPTADEVVATCGAAPALDGSWFRRLAGRRRRAPG